MVVKYCKYCGHILSQCVCTEEDVWWEKSITPGNCWACGRPLASCICNED